MNDEAKLGLIAGVLAVVGAAAFALPRDPNAVPKTETAINGSVPPPAVNVKAATDPRTDSD